MDNSTLIYFLNQYNDNSIYIKRDDLIPFSFGGNKARKAKLFFEEIEKNKNDYVVTYGTSSSNHCRIVANIAASMKIPCIVISPEENKKVTFNSQMIQLFGAKIIYTKISEVSDTIDKTIKSLEKKGYKPYFIQGGGHGNLGTQAYINAYEEIKHYEQKNETFFDYIFFASGTGTTQAGLICGKLLNCGDETIVGISIARKAEYGRKIILNSIEDYFNEKKLEISKNDISESTIFIDQYIENGYGNKGEQIYKTIKNVLINYGVPLDTTYTGKAFYGMQQYIDKNKIINKNILFIHTGGTPLFFNDIGEML